MSKEIIKDINSWIKDFEKTQPNNVQLDPDDHTFEGSAYNLLLQVKGILEKPLKIIMVEYIGDANYWEWWDLQRDTTPQEAIQSYLDSMELDKKQEIYLNHKDNYYYAKDADVRAFEVKVA